MAYILYIGDSNPNSTSGHRANALGRIGHKVDICDPFKKFSTHLKTKIEAIHYRTGYAMLQSKVNAWAEQLLNTRQKPDIVWVNSGEWLGPKSIQILRKFNCPVLLYNNDDPTGRRDGKRFDSLIKSIPYYDLCIVMRVTNIAEFIALGAKKVLRVTMSYDEIAHQPFASQVQIPAAFRSEIAFIGTWMRHEKRDEFLIELINNDLPISIWGGRWKKSPYWSQLQPAYRGDAIGGRDYVAAIQGAKICLGLLSKGNRDLHTTRSFEVPYAGGLLCAERTSEHTEMFVENKEAAFWSDAVECAKICKHLLMNETLRESIRIAGMHKVQKLKVGSEDICRKILSEFNIS